MTTQPHIIQRFFGDPINAFDKKTLEAYDNLRANQEIAQLAIQVTGDIYRKHFRTPGIDFDVAAALIASSIWRLYILRMYDRSLQPFGEHGSEELIEEALRHVRWGAIAEHLLIMHVHERDMAA